MASVGEITGIPVASQNPVKVENSIPTVVSAITNQNAHVGKGDVTVDVSGTFADQDGDILTFTAISNDTSVASVSVIGADMVITPIVPGKTTITVTASDGRGGTVTATFDVVVTGNQAPVVAKAITDMTIISVKNIDLTEGPTFTDANGDTLTYSVSTTDNSLVNVSETNGMIMITPLANVEGTATISVQACDGNGGTAIDTFIVTVDTIAPNPPTNLVASNSFFTTLSWNVSDSHDVSNQRLEVYINGNWATLIGFPNNTKSSHSYIMPDSQASFRVFAIDDAGNETESNIFTLTLP